MTADKPLFNPAKVQQAISYTLEPCQNCQGKNVMALRSQDPPNAVLSCLDCMNIRKMTSQEYLREWPGKACDVCRNKNIDIELKTVSPHQRCDLCGYRQGY